MKETPPCLGLGKSFVSSKVPMLNDLSSLCDDEIELILDVGCGNNPHGDINVDLYGVTPQIFQSDIGTFAKTAADIICDGNFLPFREGVFDRVVSYHAIEHTKTPFSFLRELLRVSKGEVEIKCPHRYSLGAKLPFHESFFDRTWFAKACTKLGVRLKTTLTYREFWVAFFLFPVRFPDELTILIFR